MRNILLLLLTFAPLITCAQKTFKFTLVNADTGKPMVKKWITVLQNESK